MQTSPQAIQQHLSLFSQPARLRGPAFRVIDRMDQRVPPSDQLLATAVALVAMTEACGVDMRELIVRAEACMGDVDSCGAEQIRAIRHYASNEILRR